jgi:hypothetical protein
MTIQERFADFCERNPHILEELESRALLLRSRGARRIGVKAIWEAMRFDAMVRTDTRDFKLNNDFTALYARLLIERHPLLADVIETRERRAA